MLNWAQQFNIFCLLDNQQYHLQPGNYEYLLGAGCTASFDTTSQPFQSIDAFLKKEEWTFGHLAYDLGYQFQNIKSDKQNKIPFPPCFFFHPQIVIFIKENHLHIECADANKIYKEIIATNDVIVTQLLDIDIHQKLSQQEYIQKINALQKHIQKGDCYEINFCQEFFAEEVALNVAAAFHSLCSLSPNPYSAFYKWNDQFLICASPERFLTKKGNKLFSQPMKGTAKRIAENNKADEKAAQELYQSAKDRSENVMIVDLVRNDLSIICESGTVEVEELFSIYSFPTVHQMVSTISGTLKKNVSFSQIIKATFPMGSMTGAPKKRVMALIEEYEESNRGIFSGSVGYIAPNSDFDFNVTIRSMMYNAANKYLSYQVGSGITFYSNPEKEWEECLLKGEGIKKVLTSASTVS